MTCAAMKQHIHTVCGCFIPCKLHNQEVTLPYRLHLQYSEKSVNYYSVSGSMPSEVLSCGSLKIKKPTCKDPIVDLYE